MKKFTEKTQLILDSVQAGEQGIAMQANRYHQQKGAGIENKCSKHTKGSPLYQQCMYDAMYQTEDISEQRVTTDDVRGIKDTSGLIAFFKSLMKKKDDDEENGVNEQILAADLMDMTDDQIKQVEKQRPDLLPGGKKKRKETESERRNRPSMFDPDGDSQDAINFRDAAKFRRDRATSLGGLAPLLSKELERQQERFGGPGVPNPANVGIDVLMSPALLGAGSAFTRAGSAVTKAGRRVVNRATDALEKLPIDTRTVNLGSGAGGIPRPITPPKTRLTAGIKGDTPTSPTPSPTPTPTPAPTPTRSAFRKFADSTRGAASNVRDATINVGGPVVRGTKNLVTQGGRSIPVLKDALTVPLFKTRNVKTVLQSTKARKPPNPQVQNLRRLNPELDPKTRIDIQNYMKDVRGAEVTAQAAAAEGAKTRLGKAYAITRQAASNPLVRSGTRIALGSEALALAGDATGLEFDPARNLGATKERSVLSSVLRPGAFVPPTTPDFEDWDDIVKYLGNVTRRTTETGKRVVNRLVDTGTVLTSPALRGTKVVGEILYDRAKEGAAEDQQDDVTRGVDELERRLMGNDKGNKPK